jgi:hypothetical protein
VIKTLACLASSSAGTFLSGIPTAFRLGAAKAQAINVARSAPWLMSTLACRKALIALLPLSATTLLLGARPAQAILTYNIFESGGNVVVEATGSLNVSSPTGVNDLICNQPGLAGALVPSNAVICTGPNVVLNRYAITGPLSFQGIANIFGASTVSSGLSTLLDGPDTFGIDSSYVNGAAIVSSATFNGQTLAGLGFTTPGLLGTWTLTEGGDQIRVVLTDVPGPLPLLGAGAAFGFSRRLRRRISASQSTLPQA